MSSGYVPIPVWRVEDGDVVPGVATCQAPSNVWFDLTGRGFVSLFNHPPACLGRWYSLLQ
jgi:hypothetical protein